MTPSQKTLSKFSGPLLLVGAGKMGTAMLDGWLARGLDPKKVVVIEPQPGKASRRWRGAGSSSIRKAKPPWRRRS